MKKIPQKILFFFFWLNTYLMEVPRSGTESKPQLQQPQILNPVHQARDGITPVPMQRQCQILNSLHHCGDSRRLYVYLPVDASPKMTFLLVVHSCIHKGNSSLEPKTSVSI